MRTLLAISIISLFTFFSCSEDEKESPFYGFYEGGVQTRVTYLDIMNGDTVESNNILTEELSLSLRNDDYYTQNRSGSLNVINDSILEFSLEVDNCFFGFCEPVLNGPMTYSMGAGILSLEDEIKYFNITTFGLRWVFEDRIFILYKN